MPRTSIFLNVPLALVLLAAAPADLRGQRNDRAEAEAHLRRAVTALHHFEYEDAYEAFQLARRADPESVMACWGEAMTYHQTLWRQENVAAGRRALAALGATPAVRATKARDPKERAYLSAVEALFGDGSPGSPVNAVARHRAYAAAMAAAQAQFPDDPDLASFYALALLGGTSRSLIGFTSAADGHDHQLAGSAVQQQIAMLLEQVLARHPDHPGALHYLLHTYDDPEHAPKALAAARAYARIAGGASHALHMPAHIFLQLGLWHDAASSDRAAFDASDQRTRRRGENPSTRNYHALAWLQYELLQLGRYRDALQTLDEIESGVRAASSSVVRRPSSGDEQTRRRADEPTRRRADEAAGGSRGDLHQPLVSDRASMRARYVIETRRWAMLANERSFGNVDELLAIGLSAARSGNLELATRARDALAARATTEQEGDLRPAIAIMEREVAAALALAGGRRDEAIGILEAAARAESALPAPLGLPSPAKPSHELLGEVLLEQGRPLDARAAFEQALGRHRNRSLSLLGLARAWTALRDTAMARQYYSAVVANFDRADVGLVEVAEAKAALRAETKDTKGTKDTKEERRGALTLMGLAAGMTIALALGLAIFRRKRTVETRRVQTTRRKKR